MDIKIPGSILGIILILGLVLFPGYIVEELKKRETSEEGIISSEELQSIENATYTPYSESNNDTVLEGGRWAVTGKVIMYQTFPAGMDNSVTYNIIGYTDYLTHDVTFSSTGIVLIHFQGTAEDLLTDGVNTLILDIDSDDTYKISSIKCGYLNTDLTVVTYDTTGGYFEDSTERTGSFRYYWNISEAVLNAHATHQYLKSDDRCIYLIEIHFPDGCDPGILEFNSIWEPEYYQTTTYENSTNTTYEPYILTISSAYTIRYYVMGLAGILMIGIALIISPLVDPSNWFKGGKR